MRAKHIAVALTGLFVGLAVVESSEARVVRLVVEQRASYVGGADWGKAGPYEMLRGTAYMEADPHNPQDAVVVDLQTAQREASRLISRGPRHSFLTRLPTRTRQTRRSQSPTLNTDRRP